MIRTLLIIILVGLLAWVGFDRAVNTPWLVQRIVPKVIERSLSGSKVAVWSVKSQRLLPKAVFQLEDLELRVIVQGQTLIVTVPSLTISGVTSLLSSRRALTISMMGARIIYEPGEARGVSADLAVLWRDDGFVMFEGPLIVDELHWDKIKAKELTTQIVGNSNRVEWRGLKLSCYGGVMQGQGQLRYFPLSYDTEMTLSDIEASSLSEINSEFSSQVEGRFSGTFSLSGDVKRLTAFKSAMSLPEGGKVNAALLSSLTQYLPKSREKKRLDMLIKIGEKLAVEVFSFTIQSDAPDHLSGAVHLASKDANIQLNLTHDIHIDGTWEGLAQSWSAIFRK